jgi:FkbM family methyltransferase
MLVKKKVHGSIMLLDTGDPGISVDLWRDGTREWNCPELMLSILKPGMVCIEAGACLGFYALMEARRIGKRGHVYAIEPNPNNIKILDEAIKLNKYKNITTHNLAIGDSDGLNEFLIEHRSNLGRIVKTKARDIPDVAIVETVRVKEQKLDSFVNEQGIDHVDLLRFDIESYEIELIAGAQKTLSEMPAGSWIFGEFHTIHFEDPARDLQPAIQSLIDHGFVPRHVVNMLDASETPVGSVENMDPSDFARACCEDFPQSAPRIFWEKVG